MQDSNPSSISILDKLFKAIDSIGLKRTEQVLNAACCEEILVDNEDVQHVVTIISDKFNIPIGELINGSGRKNERRFAIGFCSYYLNEIYKMDYMDIAIYLKKHLTIVQKYTLEIKKLNPKHISDQKYCHMKMVLDPLFIITTP